MSTPRLRALVVAVLAVGILALPAMADARLQRFQTPSKKIGCGYETSSRELRCDALFLNDVGFRLRTTGKGKRIRITDTVADPGASVLRYGRSRDLGPFRCTSRMSGLTCKSRANGHGFTISRGSQKLF